MKLHEFEMLGVGRVMAVHLVIGDEPDPSNSRQWMEATVEIPSKAPWTSMASAPRAMTLLRDALNAQIAALRSGLLG